MGYAQDFYKIADLFICNLNRKDEDNDFLYILSKHDTVNIGTNNDKKYVRTITEAVYGDEIDKYEASFPFLGLPDDSEIIKNAESISNEYFTEEERKNGIISSSRILEIYGLINYRIKKQHQAEIKQPAIR